jgi:hypothetical protein
MPKTRAQKIRGEKQAAVREKLAMGGHVQHIETILGELMDSELKIDQLGLQRRKLTIDTKLALIKKYIPDLKAVEITGADGGDITTSNKFTVEVIGAESSDSSEVTTTTEA